MDASERDELPMLSSNQPYSFNIENPDSRFNCFTPRVRSQSISIPMESYENENSVVLVSHTGPLVSHTGPLRNERKVPFVQMSGPLYVKTDKNRPMGQKQSELTVEKYPSFNGMDESESPESEYAGQNQHLWRSGQLGLCNDPYCTTCPSIYKQKQPKSSRIFDPQFHNNLYGEAKGCATRCFSFLRPCIPGIMNPHSNGVQQWNKFFAVVCSLAIFIDPLFFFLLSSKPEEKCIVINWPMTTTIVVLRSLTDFFYLLNILLQFRLAYVAPESRVVGSGDLVDHPKKIALKYLTTYFALDFFIMLPLPQVMILLVLPKGLGTSGANYAKNLLRTAVLIQYIPRLYRFIPFLIGMSPSGIIFESARGNFVINLLTFMLSGHVIGSCWYLFGLQRVNQCLRDACRVSTIAATCTSFIDCGHGDDLESLENNPLWSNWKSNVNASDCFGTQRSFSYGIYEQAVVLTTKSDIVTRYIYSLFWGFQQISTLAGNQTPSYFVPEVLFTMGIIGLGLLLFALLIGNIQNFLQSLGRRRLEMSLRRRDVEQWMSHRRLPEKLRSKVRQSERYNWAATRGVNEELLLENLPEDLQRDIRRHLFKFVKKVRIFGMMDETILDAICERLRQKTYIEGCKILDPGCLIEKMVFIVRGKMESIGDDRTLVPLCEGDVSGEELLTWCLEHSSVSFGKDGKKTRNPGHRLLSNRMVRCLTNVEAFTLKAADIEEVTSVFSRFLRSPRVQGAIRYESPYWRGVAAHRIQVAWRYRQKRLHRAESGSTSSAVSRRSSI